MNAYTNPDTTYIEIINKIIKEGYIEADAYSVRGEMQRVHSDLENLSVDNFIALCCDAIRAVCDITWIETIDLILKDELIQVDPFAVRAEMQDVFEDLDRLGARDFIKGCQEAAKAIRGLGQFTISK